MDFIQSLTDNDVDIAFVAETWMTCANNLISGLLKESGYNMFHSFRSDQKGGGVAIVTKSSFLTKGSKTFKYQTFEVVLQSVKLSSQGQQYVNLVTVYRLDSSKPVFIQEFYNFLEILSINYSNLLICGDFNVHVNKPTETFVSDFSDILNTFSLSQSVHVPTHRLGNTLDLVIHDPLIFKISNLHVEKPDRSDHFQIFFDIHCNIKTNLKKKITFRNFKNVDLTKFKRDIDTASNVFTQTCDRNNFYSSLSLFNQVFGDVVESHAPLITKQVDINSNPGWLDNEFKTARRERRKLYKKWKKTKDPMDRQRFETSRREVNNLSITKRKEYFSKCISESSNSQRDLYNICYNLLDTQKCRALPDHQNPTNLANNFNNFFIHKIEKIRDELSTIDLVDIDVNKYFGMDGRLCAQSTLSGFRRISSDELKKIIRSRKMKTSAYDVMPAQLLTNSLDEIIDSLSELVNISLSNASIHGLKDSVVKPLLKKYGLDPEILSNYRPVANIPYLSKLIESVVSLELKEHMDLNDLHIPNQSGYKPKHSCETLLLCLNNGVLIAMDNGKCTIILLLDLSAAFDTVDHDRLLYILFHELGLRDAVLMWFESYLLHRQQAVDIDGDLSDFLDTPYGVPQGSVLGPILFNIYVRSLINTLNQAGFEAHGYADDHQSFKVFSIEFQYEAIRVAVPKCLDIIAHWMKASFLKLNSSKSQVIIFTPKHLSSQVHIHQIKLRNGCSIPVSTMVHNLGVVFDSELTFGPQINSICSVSYKLLRNLASVRKFLDPNDLRLLVQSIIISRIDNCNSLLYGILARNIDKLQKLQNSCARLIYSKKKRDHATPLLHELHWLPIKQRIVFKLLLLVFKFYQDIVPVYIKNLLTISTRDNSKLIVPRANTPYGDRAFEICAPRLWNALPSSIRNSDTLSYFRSHLKHHLFSNFDNFMAQANIYTG